MVGISQVEDKGRGTQLAASGPPYMGFFIMTTCRDAAMALTEIRR